MPVKAGLSLCKGGISWDQRIEISVRTELSVLGKGGLAFLRSYDKLGLALHFYG